VQGFSGVPTGHRPILFVGNHQTYAPDLPILVGSSCGDGRPHEGLAAPHGHGNGKATHWGDSDILLETLATVTLPVATLGPPCAPCPGSEVHFESRTADTGGSDMYRLFAEVCCYMCPLYSTYGWLLRVPLAFIYCSVWGRDGGHGASDTFRLFGAVPVTAANTYKLLANGEACAPLPRGCKGGPQKPGE